jgi:hypothetical protein
MPGQTTDVMVHVERPIDAAERARLELALSARPGIRAVRSSSRAAQLLLIDYDPGAISALGVLRCFQTLGLEARLVGM